jgi:hypothetical protein
MVLGQACPALATPCHGSYSTVTTTVIRVLNYSEFLGNGAISALGNLYYPDSRSGASNALRLGTFIGTDALGNVLKEFWPDIKKKLERHH